MNETTGQIRALARQLFAEEEIKWFVGWGTSRLAWQSPPLVIADASRIDDLVWNDYCLAGLAKYALPFAVESGKVALLTRGCDSLGIKRLLADNRLSRDKLILIGIECPGLKEISTQADGSAAAVPAAKCRNCRERLPEDTDFLLRQEGSRPQLAAAGGELDQRMAEMEKWPLTKRHQYWQQFFRSCLRCYACRNACPACSCIQCVFTKNPTPWLEREITAQTNEIYAVTRAMHVAGRCIGCGECERVCPVGIPLMEINHKVEQDIAALFGEEDNALNRFRLDDPDEFI